MCDRIGEKAYIGECENFVHRIKDHEQKKVFWEIAIAFVAKDNSLEKGDIKYLESLSVEVAKNAARMEITNLTVPSKNNLHKFKALTLPEFFEDVKLLTSTLGYPLFDKIVTDNIEQDDLWYCKGKNTNATGIYNEAGFTVLSGSVVNALSAPSFASHFPKEAAERIEKLSSHGKLISDTEVQIVSDLTFASVSRASGFCLGRSSNGWTDWKNKDNKTMDETLRQQL